MNLNKFLPRSKKQEQIKQAHSKFIQDVIDYLKLAGYSIHDSQIVAQITEIASRGEKFNPLLQAAQKAVQVLMEAKLHPIDALLAAQLMALIMKNDNPQRIIDGAEQVSELYVKTGFQQNLFSTDMAIMGQRLTEALGSMKLDEVNVDSKI